MKLDMLFLLSASSAFVFLARDAFAIPVPSAAASYHHVKRMENFEPVFNGILNRVEGAARGPVRLLADGDDAIHAGRSLTLALTPHSFAQPIRPHVMQHAWNDAPYFWTSPARPHTLAHPYGEPDVTVTRPHMHVVSTSMVGHSHPFALEGGRGDLGGRRSQDGVATVPSNDERLVRQPGDEHVAGPSSRPLSMTEYFQRLGDVEIVEEGEQLLQEALAKGQYSGKYQTGLFISEADARLQSWLLEVFRRRIEQVEPNMQESYRHVLWSFIYDSRQIVKRGKQYKGMVERTEKKATSVAHGPFYERNIDSPLQPFNIGSFIFHVIQQHAPRNIGLDTNNWNDIDIIFSVRRDGEVSVVSFGRLWVTPAPRLDDIPDALVNQ